MQLKTNKNRGFFAGASYLFQGFSMLFQAGIRHYVIIPLLLNIILFTGLFIVNIHFINQLVLYINIHIPSWLKWLDWLLYPLLFGTILIVMSYSFSLVANLIAAPFNGFLSESVEKKISGKGLSSESFMLTIADTPRVIMRQIYFIVYYLPRMLFMLLLFVVPLVHIFAVFLWFLFNAWMMTLQYSDYPMDNHRVSFYKMRAILRQNRALSFGFGSAVMLCTLIPFVNFLVIPAAVIGATIMSLEHYKASFERK